MSTTRPIRSVRARGAMVASADQLATQAGMWALARGGNAVDAAIATNAAIAVTGPHLCGMGGDLFALVHDGTTVHALDASGRAGSGSNAAQLRAEGFATMPFRHDIRTVTVPGCVDGWSALHERFGRLPMHAVLEPAIRLAEHGFPASPLLIGSLALADVRARDALAELVSQIRRPGDLVKRPGVARALRAIAEQGRDGFYLGEFGNGLRMLGNGLYDHADLALAGARWVTPLSTVAYGQVLHTIPPSSQGYLLLGAAAIAEQLDLPADMDDPQWAHLLIEAAKVAGFDRPAVLHDRADGAALLAAIAARAGSVQREHASHLPQFGGDGDTTYLCTVDDDRMGVSLIQSNASGFGSWIVEPSTAINLHNRGLGFSLEEGHPAELAPGHRPPHTLSPALATDRDGSLRAVFGTMGGDAQPQILLQVATRLFHHGTSVADAITAPRWVLHGPTTGFDTWTGGTDPHVVVEASAPDTWRDDLTRRGHDVRIGPSLDSGFGHAHAIAVGDDGVLAGAADPRAAVGSVAGL